MTDPCPHCPKEGAFDISPDYLKETLPAESSLTAERIRHFCFHAECPDCSDLSSENICEVCSHLRLRHAVRSGLYANSISCARLLKADPEIISMSGFSCDIGTVAELRKRSERSCSLCRVFVQGLNAERNLDAGLQLRLLVHRTHSDLKGYYFKIALRANPYGESKSSDILHTYTGIARELDGDDLEWIGQSQVPAMVQWPQISTWLEQDRAREQQAPPAGLRVIDCKRGCVINAPSACRYAALSYVWGNTGTPQLQATSASIDDLGLEGALFAHHVPQTIQDAILVCTRLEVRYLWVDRLCILQDVTDPQLDAMGTIYLNAFVTIVALAGNDADYGLPGVSRRRNTVPDNYHVSGVTLAIHPPGYRQLTQHSKWVSRGWKFQEALLSSRMLLFSDFGVFFESNHTFKQEYTPLPRTGGSDRSEFLTSVSRYYEKALNIYTKRDLTFKSDIIRAFSGFLYWKFGQDNYYGLPFRDFTQALFWQSLDGTYPSRECSNRETFPSWSWSSIMGGIAEGEIFLSIPLARWAMATPSPTGFSVRTIQDWDLPQEWTGALDPNDMGALIAWRAGCFPSQPPPELAVDMTWAEADGFLKSSWSSFGQFVCFVHGIPTDSASSPEDLEAKFPYHNLQLARRGSLLGYTQSLRVRIALPSQGADEYIKFKLPTDNKIIGWLIPKATNQDRLHEIYNRDPNTHFDIIALELRSTEFWSFDNGAEDGHLTGSAYTDDALHWQDSNGDNLLDCEDKPVTYLVRVMLVETRLGISRRVGLGMVYLRVWMRENPQFRTFVLA